jgi:nicotinamidase-related amidase
MAKTIVIPTLVVVDMQSFFSISVDWRTVLAVKVLVDRMIDIKAPIVILEFGPNLYDNPRLRTHPYIMQPLSRPSPYGSYSVVTKFTDDGSDEVIGECKARGFGLEYLMVCGVKTHVCVRQTVCGLSRKLPGSRIEVVRDACNSDRPFDWTTMPTAGNILLV